MNSMLRQSLRQFAERPGSSALLVLILALGIGVNSAMFGLTDLVLFRPLPVSEPDRVVRVFTREPESGEFSNGSYPWSRELADLEGVFDGVAAYTDWASLGVRQPGGGVAPASAGLASGAFFEVLGVQASRGRVFGSEVDEGVGQHPVAVISDAWWRTRFDADPDVLGSRLTIAGQPYQVIGVLPPGFNGPALGSRVDFWLPLTMAPLAMAGQIPEDILERRAFSWLDVVARLPQDTALPVVQQAVDAWATRRLATMAADEVGQGRGPHALLMPLRDAAVDPYGTEDQSRRAWMLVAIALLVLAIAGANAAGLLAVRGEDRSRELAVRVSLGAGPRALVVQLLLEALVLVLAGTVLGVGLGLVLAHLVIGLQPGGLALPPDAASGVLQPRVLALTFGCAAFTLLLGSLAPARRALRLNVVEGLRAGGIHGTADGGRQRWRGALVAAQLALTLTLLVSAGLLLRSLWLAERVDPGFDPEGRATASVSLARPGITATERARVFAAIRDRVAALPGVQATAWMTTPPVQNGGMRSTMESDVPGTPKGDSAQVDLNIVSDGALELIGVPLLRGRMLEAADSGRVAERVVAVVNRAYAEAFFPGVDPIGRRIVSFASEQGGVEVVGVVGDVRQRSLRAEPPPQVYLPQASMEIPRMSLLVHADGEVSGLLGQLPRVIAEVDPEAMVTRVRTLDAQMALTLSQSRLFAWLLIGFAALATVLAGSGLYGSVSAWLRACTREIGIRVALGASEARIARLVAQRSVRLLALALPVGVLLALASARGLDALLFGVGRLDPASWLVALALLVLTAAAAVAVPLRRALRLAPTEALRQD